MPASSTGISAPGRFGVTSRPRPTRPGAMAVVEMRGPHRLIGSNVTVLGCGSVGAPVAVALAQAGVGRINLVDHDALAWANVGRHPLGAPSLGRNKAEALAAKLRSDFPHATFEAFPT